MRIKLQGLQDEISKSATIDPTKFEEAKKLRDKIFGLPQEGQGVSKK